MENTVQGNNFELILTVKWKLDVPFSSEFRAICNQCVVMAAYSRKALKFCEKSLRFLEKRPLTVKFSKFHSQSFHRDTDRRRYLLCSNCVKFGRRKIGEIVRYLPDKKQTFACLSNCR